MDHCGTVNKRVFESSEYPEGFHRGKTIKLDSLPSNKGKKCYNDGIHNKLYIPGEEPEGYLPGKLKYIKHKPSVKRKWITDGTTNNQIPIESDIPEGFRLGVTKKEGYMWITDGNKNTRILCDSDMPSGWHRGVSNVKRNINCATLLKKGLKWCNNGIVNKIYYDEVPDGYVAGRLKMPAKDVVRITDKRWYNNGIEQRLFVEGSQPDGYELGRLNNPFERKSTTNMEKL